MRSVRLALGAGVLLVLVLLVVVLSPAETRLAGSNAQVRVSGAALSVYPGQRRCQLQDLPEAAGAVRVFARPLWETETGPIDLIFLEGKRELGRARILSVSSSDAAAEGKLDRPIVEEVVEGRVCVFNRAPTPVEFAGDRTPVLGGPANLAAQTFDDDVRVDLLRPEAEAWWELAPTVAARFSLSKASFFGSWTFWATLALVGIVWALTLRFLGRALGSS